MTISCCEAELNAGLRVQAQEADLALASLLRRYLAHKHTSRKFYGFMRSITGRLLDIFFAFLSVVTFLLRVI